MIDNKRITSCSNRIKEAMRMANKTQADLVKDTGLNKSTISRYLSGVCEPKQNAVAKLAQSLNVSEMWLWGYDVPVKNKKTATNNGNGISEAKRKLIALAEECSEDEAEHLLKVMELILSKK